MSDHDKLDKLLTELRQSEPYLHDDGFTAAVTAKLPEIYELPIWLKNLIILLATVAGSAITVWQIPVHKLILFANSLPLTLPVLAMVAVGVYLMSYVVVWMVQTDFI